MIEFGRLIIVTFKIIISAYMVYKTIISEDHKESLKLMDSWCVIGFFAFVEYITDKYGHAFCLISNSMREIYYDI